MKEDCSPLSVVCSLALPPKEVGPARREINHISRDWPRKDGELKGGLLQSSHLEALVDVLFRHDALLQACATDVSSHDPKDIDYHKASQCEGITKHLTSEHDPNFVREVWELRHTLERIPNQLYIQCVLMCELVASAAELTSLYFAQRRPRELGQFTWKIDAKDPKRITTQEAWWRDTVGAMLENKSLQKPRRLCDDPSFDYRFLERNHLITMEIEHPHRSSETVVGFNIKKIVTDDMSFVVSHSDTLLQAVDILANFLRRLLIGKIAGDDVA
jgi:hypothetical protein